MCKKCSCVLECGSMICVLILLTTIVLWSRNYFTQLIENMKDARTQLVEADGVSLRTCSCATNSVPTTQSTIDKGEISPPGITNGAVECGVMIQRTANCCVGQNKGTPLGDKAHDDSLAICIAYETLDREFTSWLTVLGLFAGVFGLIVPLASYLLQHHTLNTEREQIIKGCQERMMVYVAKTSNKMNRLKYESEEQFKSVSNRLEGRTGEVNGELVRCQTIAIRSLEFPLTMRINQMIIAQRSGKISDTIDIVNIIIGFDYLLEGLVRWSEDVVIVREKIHDWINKINAIWCEMTAEQREKVWELLRTCFRPLREFAVRNDYLKILRVDSEEFKWLANFFEPFAPWKFS